MDNLNENSVKETVAIATDKSWINIKKTIKVENIVLNANWINRLNPKKPLFKMEVNIKSKRFDIKVNIKK